MRFVGVPRPRQRSAPRRRPWTCLSLSLLALASGSCGIQGKLARNLEANAASQRQEVRGLFAGIEQPSEGKPMDWRAAQRRMMKHNLSIRQSEAQLAQTKKLRWKKWFELLPKVGSYVNIGASLSELSNLEADDLSARLVANLSIPNPFQFHASLYAIALQQQNAEWSHELDRRRLYAQLYEAFIEAEAIAETEAAFESKSQNLSLAAAGDISTYFERMDNERRMLERRKAYHRLKVNQLLNTPGGNWRLAGEIPQVTYRDRIGRLGIGEDFGKLAANLEAVQIEAALLQLKRVKFQQWPTVNLGLGLPALYSSEESAGFSSEELFLFSGANKSIDLTDIAGLESIADAKQRLQFTRERLQQNREREAMRFSQLISTYRHLLERERQILQRMERGGGSGLTSPDGVIKDLETRSALQLRRIEIRRQLQQLDLQFLIWDETFWKS